MTRWADAAPVGHLDHGVITGAECVLRVQDVKKTPKGYYVHTCTLESGIVHVGDHLTARVDKEYRIPYSSWWPQELPDERIFEEARAKFESMGWKVDYVITHTCSTRMLSPTLYPAPGWNCPTVDRLTAFFDELEDRMDYKRWYYGHFHRDANPAERHTVLYDCIVRLGDELQPWDVA